MDLHNAHDYREILGAALASRCSRNPRYSQRAFARDLAIAPNRLSQVLRGKLGLSRHSALNVARRLNLSTGEQTIFCDLVEREHGRSRSARQAARARLAQRPGIKDTQTLSLDQFQLIADWYHLAIVELAKVQGFSADPRWIAGCLGIGEAEARLALERLERLGIIRVRGQQLDLRQPDNAVPGGTPSAAIRAFHSRLIERGLAALETQPLEERAFNTSLVAMPRARMPEIRSRIQAFWQELFRDLEQSDQAPDDLYCMAIQFFHLTDRSRLTNQDEGTSHAEA